MSKYDELVRIYLQAKDEHENNGILCQNFAHDLMKSIFRAFGCPAGIMVGDTKRDQKNFWNTSFSLPDTFAKSFWNKSLRGCPIVYALWKARPIQKEQTMSDTLRQYRAIREALRQAYPGEPQGRCARHLTTLAALISGIVASKSTQLPKVAAKVPNGTKPESRVKRFARWLDNAHILEEVYFLPYAEIVLAHLALETLVLVMDGSVVGCGCVALMIHVLYKGRALPLAWRVRQGPKGHFPEDLHIALVELIRACLPEGTPVVFLGDGEFDGWDNAAKDAQ
jgi:hypothetical protein